MKKATKILAGVMTSFASLTGSAYAVNNPSDPATYLPDIGPQTDLIPWIKGVLNLVIGISGLVSVVILIVAGYMFITANGNEDTIQKATKTLTFAIIGLVICLISVLIVQFVLTRVIGS
jgi:cytochrome bd-type quinol oxidase subunit 2